jgi:hydrogenase maturation protein HypF
VKRFRIDVCGCVQGVGFRPFVYRLAKELDLTGWVSNGGQGVAIELEGYRIDSFIERLRSDRPPHARIETLSISHLEPAGYRTFEIRESDGAGEKTAIVTPDIATCAD